MVGTQESSGEVQVDSSEPFHSLDCKSLAPSDSQ
ncbi:hypothetical protein RS9916_33997 [Synechococcus sp. RS9916]|nr:hypothetical protein RS9916_33997 [Synechococcus sp. RS9916]